MRKITEPLAARERLLDAAENLFSEHGYSAVKLRDIAALLGLSHASLYYHFPGGKESLFIEVTERNLRRHGAGLDAAIAAAGSSVRSRLRAASGWLLSQPPMDLIRMARTDMPALAPADGRRLMDLAYGLLILRLKAVLDEAVVDGEIGCRDTGLVAGGLIGLVESMHAIPGFALRRSRIEMAGELVDVMLAGLGYQEGVQR
ncbi:MAG: helix-turn-helix domain containing protein [Spirochaetes bacterium]|nr:helix-turn-helix domain containing protein [Spirochaetota bacterium]